MRDRSDRYQVQTVPTSTSSNTKRLGSYLLEAGLLTPAQVHVALNDQKATGMRFGEVLVARGWLKEQTVEWVMQKVIVPERRAVQSREQAAPAVAPQVVKAVSTRSPVSAPPPSPPPAAASTAQSNGKASQNRRDLPIAKPLPPVNSSDNDVSWVG
jgi:hypothetical protein